MAIPKAGQFISQNALELQHPDYRKKYLHRQLHYCAFTGEGGFETDTRPFTPGDVVKSESEFKAFWASTPNFDETYLQPLPRERQGFTLRLRRAHYENRLQPSVRMLAGFLTRRKPNRQNYKPRTTEWLKAVSMKGVDWDRWLSTQLVPWLLVFGEVVTVFDRPLTMAMNLADQKAAGADRLVVQMIHPLQMLDWSIDEHNRYRYIKTKVRVQLTDTAQALKGQHVIADRYTWYNDEGWWVVDIPVKGPAEFMKQQGQPRVRASFEWDAGVTKAPISVWRLGENGDSLIKDAAAAARTHYNMVSLLINILVECGFPMLVGPELKEDEDKLAVGANNYLQTPRDATHLPKWIQPGTEAFAVMMEIIEHLEESQNAMTGLGLMQSKGTTGPARRFDFAYINSFLGGIIGDIAEGEHESMQIVAEMHREKYDASARAEYTESFEAVDIEALLQSLESLQRLSPPPEVMAAGMKKAIGLVLGDMDEETKGKLEKVIDVAVAQAKLGKFGAMPHRDEDDDDEDDDEPPPAARKDGTKVPPASSAAA